ncbi:AfsR/SARP family transcriptional regulator [Plantactinospora endophytica]|nr:BTAD domain-containing putative transcriptional regulator [Plantactinospora endophytica]
MIVPSGNGVSLAAPRHRAFLAYLLLHADRVVTPRQMVEALWGGAEPHSARTQIHVVVSQLRRALREHGVEDLIDTQPGGYRLVLGENELDAKIFDREMAAARNDADRREWAGSASRLRTALGMWRGQALAEITAPYAESTRYRLHEERLNAYELLAESELELGRHDMLISGLRRLVEEHPSRERLVCHLMLAQYRAGRRTEALETARRARTLLVEEHGLDPGARLTLLEKAILNADASLDLRREAVRAAPAHDTGQAVQPPAATHMAIVTPAQLPLDQRDFIGRDLELARLSALAAAGNGLSLVLVTGMAGVGKTALVVHWAHRHRDRFRDGQLYVDLRGFDPARAPATPLDVLGRFLRALGVPPGAIPDEVDEAAALFRSRLSDRRVLIVLDNAHDAEQVRPLLAGSPDCAVLITSRTQLRPLLAREGVRLLELDPLAPDEAHDLLRAILGERIDDGTALAVRDLARHCSYLPLALRLAAAQLACQRHLTVAGYTGQMAACDPLSVLDSRGADDEGVSLAFSLSYRALGGSARRLFRLLSLVPGPDFAPPVAAALLGEAPAGVRRPLDELQSAHLITGHRPGRFLMHDLLRNYATTCLTEETTAERTAAARRLVDFYAQTVFDAYPLLQPRRSEGTRDRVQPPVEPLLFAERTAALDWHDQEREHLVGVVELAAEQGWHRCASELAADLMAYLNIRRRWSDWLAVLRIGRACAEKTGNVAAMAQLENAFGIVHKQTGQYAAARKHYVQAIELATMAGRDRMVAAFRVNLGGLCINEGDFDASVRYLRAGLASPTYGQRPQYACAGYINLGCALLELERYAEAVEALQTALDLSLEVDDIQHVCLAHHNLAEVALRRGDRAVALHHAGRQLELAVELGDPLRTAAARDQYASALAPVDLPAARDHWRAAYQVYQDLGHGLAGVLAEWLRVLDGFHDAAELAAADDAHRRHARRML